MRRNKKIRNYIIKHLCKIINNYFFCEKKLFLQLFLDMSFHLAGGEAVRRHMDVNCRRISYIFSKHISFKPDSKKNQFFDRKTDFPIIIIFLKIKLCFAVFTYRHCVVFRFGYEIFVTAAFAVYTVIEMIFYPQMQ